MSKTKYSRIAASVAFLAFGLVIAGCATASEEAWKTIISCGGSQYVVTSYCKASGDAFELNTCRPGQQLAVGKLSIVVPSGPRTAKQSALFATHWQCVQTHTGSYLLLDFSSGSGRTSSDEAVEFYDKQLHRVTDEVVIRSIYKHAGKAPEGYVKSIYPGEGN